MNDDVIVVTVRIGDNEPVSLPPARQAPPFAEGALRFQKRKKRMDGWALVLQQKILRDGEEVWIDVPVVDQSGDLA